MTIISHHDHHLTVSKLFVRDCPNYMTVLGTMNGYTGKAKVCWLLIGQEPTLKREGGDTQGAAPSNFMPSLVALF